MRSESIQVGACVFGLLVALGATLPLARGDAKLPTIGVAEIKDGMKGYGLTVFKGVVPERFDVEVVGVLHNFRPAQDLVLIKTPHPRLDITKNVKGMSGSPIYFDGRLAGAYAYSWASFQVEPVAGMTPIAPMLTELERPVPPGFWPPAGPSRPKGSGPLPSATKKVDARPKHAFLDDPTRYEGPPGAYDLKAHAAQLAARFGGISGGGRDGDGRSADLVPASTPLMVGGATDGAVASLRRLFEPLGLEPMQAGGASGASPDPAAPMHYVDGGAVGVQMVRGDVSMMGLGTVTHVSGTRLCAFGHPMMSAGNASMPTTIGRVLWIFASGQHSSKIGEAVRDLGAMVQDRQSAIVVDETARAPTFPVTVDVRTAAGAVPAPKSRWSMEVAEERFMTPGLLSSALGSVVDATVAERRDVTWRMTTKVTIRDHGTFDLEDFGVALGGMPDQDDWMRSRVVRLVGDALNNPWELALVDKVEGTLTVAYERELWRIRGAEALDQVVDPDQRARIRVRLQALDGGETSRVIEVPVPREFAGKDAEIELVPGYEVAPEVAAPESLPELLANSLRQSAPARSLVAQIKLGAVGVSYRGNVASRLPSFAVDALRPASGDVGPDPFTSYARTVVPFDRYVEGHTHVRVHVRALPR